MFGTPRFLESPSALIVEKERFAEAGCFEQDFDPPERRLQLKMSQLGLLVLIDKGLVQYRNTSGAPYFGEENWPLGWAQGYEWIIQWLHSIDHGLDKYLFQHAVGNLLRVAWQRRDRVESPSLAKKQILELARQHGISRSELNEKPPFMRKGGSEKVAREVKKRMMETPDWSSFGFNTGEREVALKQTPSQ